MFRPIRVLGSARGGMRPNIMVAAAVLATSFAWSGSYRAECYPFGNNLGDWEGRIYRNSTDPLTEPSLEGYGRLGSSQALNVPTVPSRLAMPV